MTTLVSRILSAFVIVFSSWLLAACGDSEKAPTTVPTKGAEVQQAPLLTKTDVADWCKEHSVPESICTRCNESLIAGFQAKGDWCKEHGLPESQCVTCHPELMAKFDAMAPSKLK